MKKTRKPEPELLDVMYLREAVTTMAYGLGLIRRVTLRRPLPDFRDIMRRAKRGEVLDPPCTTVQAWEWINETER